MQIQEITLDEVLSRAAAIADEIFATVPRWDSTEFRVAGVPKGGLVPAALVASALLQRVEQKVRVVRLGELLAPSPVGASVRYIIIDDLVDSGATRGRIAEQYPQAHFYALWDKTTKPDTYLPWLRFPWEDSDSDAGDVPLRLLQYIGEDPNREGLRETPARFLRAWRETWASGYGCEGADVLKAFEDGAEGTNELVLVRDIPLWSHCEHHVAPFWGRVHIGYIPDKKIVGLSKFKRLVDVYARRLQVQERLTVQIADAIQTALQPLGVGVVMECRHSCMESRGVQTAGSATVTSALRGVLFDMAPARAEFLSLVNGRLGGPL